jgi:glycosyltransferase involved in cell wall biosynthesis
MTRILVDARLSGYSGIGTYLAELLPRVMPELAEWRPVVLCNRRSRAKVVATVGHAAEVTAWETPPLSVADLLDAPPGFGRDDLLWTPHFNVPLRSRGALAVTLHDLLPLTAPEFVGRGRAMPVRLWMRAVRTRARKVFCVSDFTRGEAVRLAGIDPLRMQVTHLGVDSLWLTGEPRPAAGTAPPTIIYVGLLKPHKNVGRLLRAFVRLRDRIPHRLVLVARHQGIRNIDREALALAQRHADRVEVVQDLPFSALVERVRSAQFAAQPSLHEGFGLPALEAMAAGVPVLAARAGAMPEVCGDAALYCDPGSESDIEASLLRLATDPSLRARMIAAGRARAREFSWDRCAAATARGLAEALGEAGERR